jgi:cytochrome c oxidase subunit 4
MSGHVSPTRVYYTIFGALLVLTAITVGVAFINLGRLNFTVAITIAIVKATLVVLFFMHAKYSSRLTKLVIGGSFFFLFCLFGLTLSDYLSRGWFASPAGSAGAGTITTIDPARRPAPPSSAVGTSTPPEETTPRPETRSPQEAR